MPGWGGDGWQITPPIRPCETFVVRFTPPRAGTFIYHTHVNDHVQLSTGFCGPLIVVEPGKRFNSDVDKIFVLSRGGTDNEKDPFLINGTATPGAMHLLVESGTASGSLGSLRIPLWTSISNGTANLSNGGPLQRMA